MQVFAGTTCTHWSCSLRYALGSAYIGKAAHLDERLLDLQADEVSGRGIAVERHVKECGHSCSCCC